MTRLNIRRAALADLDAIWLHIARDDPGAADRFVDDFHVRMKRLIDHPRSGPARPEIGVDLRTVTVANYLAFDRVRGSDVDILRVVHGARDLTRLGLG